MFKIRTEPVEGVVYIAPLEKYDRKNLPHKIEGSEDSIEILEKRTKVENRIITLFNKTWLCKM